MFVFTPEIDTSSKAQDPATPSTLGEVFQSTLDANWKAGGVLSADHALEAAADRRNDAIFAATGERLENPMRVLLAPTPGVEAPAMRDPSAIMAYQAKLKELAERHPQAAAAIRADVPLLQDAGAEARQAGETATDVWDRAPPGLGKWAAWGAASIVGMASDPLLYATGPLFPEGRAAAGASGVAWQALKTGAANAALAAGEQPFLQAWRKEAGLDYGVLSAAEETAGAFLAGAGLEAGIRGGWRVLQKARGREPIVENGVVTGYRSPAAAEPSPASIGRGDPLQALDDAAAAAPEGSLIRRAQAGEPAALAEFAEKTGLHVDPTVRGALDTLNLDQRDIVPPPGVADAEHVARFNDAMAAANDPRALPHGDAVVAAHSEDAGPARIREVLRRDPLELAAEIRDTPEILSEGLPWQDPRLKAAAQLAHLSDEAFDMVAGGEAHPMLGTIVAEHVSDPDLHAGLLRRLAEADPKTPAEARSHLAELMQEPRPAATHADIAGTDPALTERPVSLVDDPYGPDAARQLEQLRTTHAAEIEAATGAKPAKIESSSAAAREPPDPLKKLQDDFDRMAAAHERLADALDRALGRLPAGVTAKSFRDIADLPAQIARDVQAARSAGYRVEALTDRQSGNIWIAADALNPDAILSHETIHALRQVGVLTDAELKLLAQKAEEFADVVAQYTPGSIDREAYRQLYGKFADEALMQEAAAHLYEARANGASFGKEANAILRKIKQFLERVRNALQGLGWQTADDVMRAIDDGTIARRAMRSVDMPGGGKVDGLPLFALRAYHSTDAKFDTFDPEFTNEVGFHFGTRQQARDRAYIKAGGNPFKFFRARTIAADIDVKNPAIISDDIGRFDGATLARQLVIDGIAPAQLLRDIAGASPAQQTRYVREWLIAQGYDGVKYVNRYEGPGNTSIMTLGTGNVRDAESGRVLFALKAYHGTPHEVDRFSSEKIGTGEGAQVYGRGLYFAENENIARWYRDKLTKNWDFNAAVKSGKNPYAKRPVYDNHRNAFSLLWEMRDAHGDVAKAWALSYLRNLNLGLESERPKTIFGNPKKRHYKNAEFERMIAANDEQARLIESGEVSLPPQDGHLYTVSIDAEPEHFLDWDKPIGEQSPLVQKALLSEHKGRLHSYRSVGGTDIWPTRDAAEKIANVYGKGDFKVIARSKNGIDGFSIAEFNSPLGPTGAVFGQMLNSKENVEKLKKHGIVGVRYLDGTSRRAGEGSYNYVVFDDSKIRITHVDGQPVSEPSNTGGALFSLRDDARAQLKDDLEQVKAITDAKAKAQRERQALLDEAIRQKNERFVTTLRDARGQVDPAKALVYMLESHGEVDMPAGMTSVAAEQKAVEAMAKAGMEEVLHAFRPTAVTGQTRQTARLKNVVRELAGEKTGDDAAKGFAQAWLKTAERLRQEFNAAGGDIPKLEGWFLSQVHDRGALLAAGKTKWVAEIFNMLDHSRILDGETRAPLSRDEIRSALGDIWENVTSDGHGTQAANAADPFGGITGDATGAKKLANQRQEHRFLHFKSADAWLDYQKQYGGGADPFRAMMQHITGMSKDIAAMRVLGTNPNRELARLAKFAMKQAALTRPAAVLIDEAVAKVKDITAQYLKTPTRLDEVSDRIGMIHKTIAAIRDKRIGPPSKRSMKKIEALRDELFALDAERIDILNKGPLRVDGIAGAQMRADLDAAYDELAAVQDVDKVLFPKKTEVLGKTMTHGGFWTTVPEDYARSYINRAEAMWDLYRGVTSAPVNAKAAEFMQMLRNIGVIGRGGSMVISSVADNFTQVMARRFTGLPAAKTMTDILAQLGPNAHREAQRQALIGETYLHMFNDGARGAASVQGPKWSNYLAERTIALQGLGALTDAQRQGFGMSLQAAFADLAVKTWAEIGALNPRLQKLLQRYGIDSRDWDAIRLDPATGAPRDADFLSPNLVRDSLEAAGRGSERIAERYLGMILQETDFASPTAMLRARAAMLGKTRPGTLVGELLRTGLQFKSFSFMFGMLHFERALREGIANGTLKGASYAAQALLVMTLGGALVVQLKDLKGGKDPRPMDRPGFWGAALLQGGGLGIWGDLLNSEQNRFGGGLVSTFGGPVMGEAEDVLGAMGLSSKTTAGRGTARLLSGYVPGSSLWYLNLAWQRTAAESLQRALDPMAYDAFRRKQQSQLKNYGNGFWWAPGDARPARAPRLN